MEILHYLISKEVTSSYEATHCDKSRSAKEPILFLDGLYNYADGKGENSTQLCELEVVAIVTILEETFLQLSISGCPDFSVVGKIEDPMYRTILERVNYTGIFTPICNEQNVPNVDTLPRLKQSLRRNCVFLLQTIQSTIKNLTLCGTYVPLQDYGIIPYFTSAEEVELIETMRDKVFRIKALKRQIQSCKDQNKIDIQKGECEIQRNQGYFVRLREFYRKEANYVERWETCRRVQNSSRLKKSELEISKMIQDCHRNIFLENFAHSSIVQYITNESKNLVSKQTEFQCQLEEGLEKLDWKYDVLVLRGRQVKREAKENAEQSKLLEEKMNRIKRLQLREEAAKIIQDWWRAIHERVVKSTKRAVGEKKKKKKKPKKKKPRKKKYKI